MVTIGLDEDERSHIFSLVFGILHLGNVIFEEEKNDEAVVKMEDCKYSKVSIIKPGRSRLLEFEKKKVLVV